MPLDNDIKVLEKEKETLGVVRHTERKPYSCGENTSLPTKEPIRQVIQLLLVRIHSYKPLHNGPVRIRYWQKYAHAWTVDTCMCRDAGSGI